MGRALACLTLLCAAGCGLGGGGVTPVRTPFNKGVYHYSRGNYEAAVAEYRLALEEDEDDHRSRFNLALALEAQADEALDRGDVATAASSREMASEEYVELLERRPGDERASINLAAIEYERGDRDAALRRLRALLDTDPDSVRALVALASYSLRDGQLSAASLRAARELLERALDENPASLEANMLLGDVLVRLSAVQPSADEDLLELARGAYARALARDSTDLATLLASARLEVQAGDLSAARTWLTHALFVDGEHLQARLLMAEVLERQGDLRGATVNLWRARELDLGVPPEHGAAEYRERLLSLYERLAGQERAGQAGARGE